jgi:hypothetical protein
MFETLAAVYHMPFAIHVFLDESQAESWLFEGAPAQPSRNND